MRECILFRLSLLLEQCKVIRRKSPSQLTITSARVTESNKIHYYLSAIHILCYTSNMILAELLYPSLIDLFTYTLLKHIIGHFFYIVFPIIVIVMKQEFRQEMKVVYRENSGADNQKTKEEKMKEISQEMLNMSSF